jgi:hypothetical protein
LLLNSAFLVPNIKVLQAFSYGNSIYGKSAKIVAQLATKEIAKLLPVGITRRLVVTGLTHDTLAAPFCGYG